MRKTILIAILPVLLGAPLPPAAAQASSANVAALQVALKAADLYRGDIDGIRGPGTSRAVKRLQRRRGLEVDGVAGPRTRRALGRRGRPGLGSRTMRRGQRGWDVAALQFLLKRRGRSPGPIDGGFGPGTLSAVRSFQRGAGLTADGVAGPATVRALRRPRSAGPPRGGGTPTGPVRFLLPINAPITDGFGMRWGRMHTGLDFPASSGSTVTAAGRGVVSFAGFDSGGYGNLVIVDHRLGYQTWYAHLSRVTSYVGEPVAGGARLGLVGSTGNSTGPHLHFEVRLNGTPVDPRPRLLGRAAAGGGPAAAAGATALRAAGPVCDRRSPRTC